MQIIMWGEMLRKSFTISVYSQNNERGKGRRLCGKELGIKVLLKTEKGKELKIGKRTTY